MSNPYAHGYEVYRSQDGNVLQSGVKTKPIHHGQDADNTMGWITRAVVLAVYFPEEDDRSGWTKGGLQRAITCDVRTYGRYSRELSRVPVLQRTHGLWDQDIYVPRAAVIDTTGGTFAGKPSGQQAPTAAEDTDGDHVLVGFLDNNPNQPVVLPYALPHPKSSFTPAKATEDRVRIIRHNGVEMRWDKDTNWSLDARGVAKPALKADGTEDSNSGTGGKITLVTTDGSNMTSLHFDNAGQVFIGSDPDSPSTQEPAVCGQLWITHQQAVIDAIVALSAACQALTVGTAVGPSTTPINATQFVNVDSTLNQLKSSAGNKEQVSDFIFVKKGY